MATKFCNDEKLRVWVMGQTNCNGDFEHCKHVVWFGKQAYCGYCPPRVGLHQVIRGHAGCVWCEHYTKALTCERCVECLSQPTRTRMELCWDCPDAIREKLTAELRR